MQTKKKVELSEYDIQAAEFLRPQFGGKDSITALTIEYLKHDKHFESDKETRDIYFVTLERAGRSYSFNFGQNLVSSGKWAIFSWKKSKGRIFPNENLTEAGQEAFKYLEKLNRERKDSAFGAPAINVEYKRNPGLKKPSEYDVLACLTTHDPERFQDFCANYGYDEDSRTAEKVYNAVRDEFLNLERLFTPAQMEQLAEIQ